MKKIKITFLITAFLCLNFACSKSDDSASKNTKDLALEQNETENRAIPTSELAASIKVEGATSKTGTPPSPNGDLDFQINTNKQEAFQEAGFDINFSTTNDIQGAYILFQDVNGNKLDNYLDIPFSVINTEKSANTKGKKSNKSRSSQQNKSFMEDDDFNINIDFKNISPGNFCYEICLYDANNNISNIQKICVEVEAWGGNSEIIGEWIFDRYEDGEDTETRNITCDSGANITVNYESVEEIWDFVLNADGSYYETYKDSYQYLDFQATEAACAAIYEDIEEENVDDEKYSGNWAYNEDKKTLTIIDFKYEDFKDSSNSQTYPNGSVYFNGNNTTAEVINGELVIVDSYDDGDESGSEIYIFKRK